MKKIVIIGGGPAGLMVASQILQSANHKNFQLFLLEGNKKLGKKLMISGGGRCNITTAIFDKKTLANKYVRGFDFFELSLAQFSPKKCKKWFEENHLPLKIQDDLRIFPKSDKSQDVLKVFTNIFEKQKHFSLHTETKVENIIKTNEKFFISTNQGDFEADILVLATGGNAYIQTGSRGDGYHFARNLGHFITKLGPSLSSFLLSDEWLKKCSGLSFSNAKLRFSLPQNPDFSLSGGILCTHFGISGPLTFMASSHLAWENISKKILFFSPDADFESKDWDNFLKEQFSKSPKKLLHTILSEKLPHRFVEIFVETFFKEIQNTFVGQISAKNRQNIAEKLGNGIKLTILDRRPGDEFVTAGGVNTDEISSETLESKICKNLYFAGEILNIDGYTGGFSLQICWSTGFAVAKSILQKLNYEH